MARKKDRKGEKLTLSEFDTSNFYFWGPTGLASVMPNGKKWGDCTEDDIEYMQTFAKGECTVGQLAEAGQLSWRWLCQHLLCMDVL